MKYTVSGVCSRSVEFDIEDGIVKNVVLTVDVMAILKALQSSSRA